MTKIALEKCLHYTEKEIDLGVSKALSLIGGMESFVKPGARVLLKPNLLAGRVPEKAVTTHPLIVKAVGKLVKDCGGAITIGDSPAIGKWEHIVSKTGMNEVAKYLDAKLVYFKETIWVEREDRHQFKKLEIAREVVNNDVIINLPKLKTHTQMFLTLGVKNIFGCLVGKRKPAWHLESGQNYSCFARRIVELYEAVNPHLTILDGVVGMEGNGPASGDLRDIGLIAAGKDGVALDRVVLEILGGKPEQLYTLKAAEELGAGVTDLDRIEIAGEAIDDVRVRNFRFPALTGVEFGPLSIRSYIKDYFTTWPVEDKSKCSICGNCVDACPPGIISRKTKGLSFRYDECIRCYCCLEVCPEYAMKIRQGLGLKVFQKLGLF